MWDFGNAPSYASAAGIPLNHPVVAITSTNDTNGYWLVASEGGIFSYGDAMFYGSTGAIALNKPIVSMTSTPHGKGHCLVASDGGIFNYGDAGFYGSAAGAGSPDPAERSWRAVSDTVTGSRSRTARPFRSAMRRARRRPKA